MRALQRVPQTWRNALNHRAVTALTSSSQPKLIQSGSVCLQTRPLSSHGEIWGETSEDYGGFLKKRNQVLESYLNSPTRFQGISEREDRSDLSLEAIKAQFMGKYFMSHRGCQLLKSADDMIIYQQLLWRLRPATVIELGTCTGGSAIWIADMLRMMEIESHIYSMDIDLSLIEEEVRKLQPENVTFLTGDCFEIEKTFHEEFLSTLPHPWLVNEDAHTNLYGVLEHFSRFMKSGDYFVVEDLNPDLPCRLGFGRVFPESEYGYEKAGTAGLEHLKKFLSDYSKEFAVDSFYTDFFGYNGTHHWHGYFRRM